MNYDDIGNLSYENLVRYIELNELDGVEFEDGKAVREVEDEE